MLRFERVWAGYGGLWALRDVTLDFGPGLHVVLGPNGAGKTTLFRVATGVLRPRAGRVVVCGRDVHDAVEAKGDVAYLPHRPGLHPGLTVWENLDFWAQLLDLEDRARRIEEVVDRLGIRGLAGRRAGTLSRGEAQRVAVARALLPDGRVLLLDEPTAGMDPASGRALRVLLVELGRSQRAVLVATHNLHEAAELAGDVVLLASGRVAARGTVGELLARFYGPRWVALRMVGDPRETLNRMGIRWERDGERWLVEVERDEDTGRLVRALVEAGLDVREVTHLGGPLETVYFGLVADG